MATSGTPFEFVSIDPSSNLKPGKSLQIRSRCMLGQNKRGGSRRTQRDEKRAAKEHTDTTSLQTQESIRTRLPPPNTLISDLALVRFAGDGIGSEDKGHLLRAFAYNFANQAFF
jgi:hypothetical protein